MSQSAKCKNYAGCLLAFRGEEVRVPAGAPFVCTECGKPLTTVRSGSPALRALPWLLGAAVVAALGFMLLPLLKPGKPAPPPAVEEQAPAAAATSAPSTGPEETRRIVAPAKIDLNLDRTENKRVKKEVLDRIDLMPNVTAANKDLLYNSVERARSMGRIVIIPFGANKSALSATEVQILKTELEKPEVMAIRSDPTSVFVVLGYADPKGDPKKNMAVSQKRADIVLATIRDRCGVSNVMHAVAMGGSTIVDAEDLEKNRTVEVWAVRP